MAVAKARRPQFVPKAPLRATVQEVRQLTPADELGSAIFHIRIAHGGRLRFDPGQSVGVLPPGGQPQRLYSIASAGPEELALCVRRVVKGDGATGSASGLLTSASPGTEVHLTGAYGHELALPQSWGTDGSRLVCLGTGTGLAPFRGFVQELRKRRAGRARPPVPPLVLYVGARSEAELPYREFWRQAQKDGLVELHQALSREPGRPKVYVQHLLAAHAEKLRSLVAEPSTHIYVCGKKGLSAALGELDWWPPLRAALKQQKRLHMEVY